MTCLSRGPQARWCSHATPHSPVVGETRSPRPRGGLPLALPCGSWGAGRRLCGCITGVKGWILRVTYRCPCPLVRSAGSFRGSQDFETHVHPRPTDGRSTARKCPRRHLLPSAQWGGRGPPPFAAHREREPGVVAGPGALGLPHCRVQSPVALKESHLQKTPRGNCKFPPFGLKRGASKLFVRGPTVNILGFEGPTACHNYQDSNAKAASGGM